MGRQEKKWGMIPIILGIFLFASLIGIVSAVNTITFATPIADGQLAGTTVLINATMDTNTLVAVNATFYYNTSSTDWVEFGSQENGSAITTHWAGASLDLGFNITWDTTSAISGGLDFTDIHLNITIIDENGTFVDDVVIAGVDIDNGNPTSTYTISSFGDGTTLSFNRTFLIEISADTTVGITNCTATFENTATNTVTSTTLINASSNACSATLGIQDLGLTSGQSYNVYMTATDGNTDKTNSTPRTLKFGGESGFLAGEKPGLQIAEEVRANPIQRFFQSFIDFFRNLFNR